MANVFENNEPVNDEDSDFIKSIAGDGPHVRLPALKEGFKYEIEKLPSGESAVIITGEVEVVEPKREPRNPEICGCSKYQTCSECNYYRGDDPDSPASRTQRHSG